MEEQESPRNYEAKSKHIEIFDQYFNSLNDLSQDCQPHIDMKILALGNDNEET